ncbi:MAG: O-antigen ligase family protein [Ruminococcus sp.]|nr:O-antigen ligase family protein [Ruminococcus sp.]
MMWLLIIIALILSYIPLINKKIDLANYMWLLIPIDAYGISIAGATIKPYMVFAFILPIILYARNKGTNFDLSASKWQLFLGIISIFIVTVNFINCDNFSSVKAALMTLIVYICAQLYCSSTNLNHIEQLSDVFIASSFGCGIVYVLAYILLENGFALNSIVALNRADNGMFLSMGDMINGKYTVTLRLRGFAFDPNTMFLQFSFAIPSCISKLFKKFNIYHILTLVISIVCILLSGSRMGLFCCIVCVIITSIVCVIQFDSIKKKLLSMVSVLVVCIGFLITTMSKWGQNIISTLLSTYSNRSSLTDEFGRLSIWKESLRIYWDMNPLFGIGYNNMSLFSSIGRMTHNTWLQFICECGFIVGGIAIIYFFTVLILGWIKLRSYNLNCPKNTSYLALVIGYTMTIIALISVDNITCSYLWFGALLLLKMAHYVPKSPHKISDRKQI